MIFTALLLSRLQFAFTITFHIIFPSFTIGLAAWLCVLEGLHLVTARPVYRRLFDFWLKIFGIAFGMGVVSGIVMGFEFCTNWSRLAEATGPIQGPLITYEDCREQHRVCAVGRGSGDPEEFDQTDPDKRAHGSFLRPGRDAFRWFNRVRVGTGAAVICAALIKIAVLPGLDTFPAFARPLVFTSHQSLLGGPCPPAGYVRRVDRHGLELYASPLADEPDELQYGAILERRARDRRRGGDHRRHFGCCRCRRRRCAHAAWWTYLRATCGVSRWPRCN